MLANLPNCQPVDMLGHQSGFWLANLPTGLQICLPPYFPNCQLTFKPACQPANLSFSFWGRVLNILLLGGLLHHKNGLEFRQKSFLLPTFVPIRNIWLLLTQFFGDQHFYGSTFFGTKISLIEISLNPNIFGLKFFLTEFFLTKIIFGQ